MRTRFGGQGSAGQALQFIALLMKALSQVGNSTLQGQTGMSGVNQVKDAVAPATIAGLDFLVEPPGFRQGLLQNRADLGAALL